VNTATYASNIAGGYKRKCVQGCEARAGSVGGEQGRRKFCVSGQDRYGVDGEGATRPHVSTRTRRLCRVLNWGDNMRSSGKMHASCTCC